MQPPVGQQPTGMFTRNLIGSLCVSAFKLTDCDAQTGIWFILQDLSVRTEGSFRYVQTDFLLFPVDAAQIQLSQHAPGDACILVAFYAPRDVIVRTELTSLLTA